MLSRPRSYMTGRRSPPRVVILEHYPAQSVLLAEILRDYVGCRCLRLGTEDRRGWNLVRHWRPDMVLLGRGAHCSELDVLALLQRYPRHRRPAVMVLTSYAPNGHLDILAQGAAMVLPKPATIDELVVAVRVCLRSRPRQQRSGTRPAVTAAWCRPVPTRVRRRDGCRAASARC